MTHKEKFQLYSFYTYAVTLLTTAIGIIFAWDTVIIVSITIMALALIVYLCSTK